MGRFKLIFLFFVFLIPISAFTQFLALDTSINATLRWFENIELQGYTIVWDGKIKSNNEELKLSKEQLQKWNEGEKNHVINSILSTYWDDGYLLAELIFSIDSIKEKNVFIKAFLDKKKQINIASVKWDDSPPLKEKRLFRMLNIELLEPLNSQILFLEPGKLLYDFIIINENPKIELLSDSMAVLHLNVKKKPRNSIEGVLGFAKLNSGFKKMQFNGYIRGNFTDLVGWGEKWNILINLGNNYQNVNITLGVPYIAGLPISISGAFKMRVQDTTYGYTEEIINLYSTDKTMQKELFVGAGQRQSTAFKQADSLIYNDYKFTYLNLGGQYLKLDNLFNPHKGYKISLQTNLGNSSQNKSSEIENNIHQLLVETYLDANSYIPINRSISLYINVLQKGVYSNKTILKNQALFVGGINDVLGIEEERIPALQLYKIEPGLSLSGSGNTYFRLFYQFASIERFQSKWGNYQSAGISFQLRTRIGWIWTAIAIPKEPKKSWDLANTRLHLKITIGF
jgi:hypothetical protein